MGIPSQTEMFKIVLDIIGKTPDTEYSRRMIADIVCNEIKLDENDLLQTTASGQLVYESRIQWAISWLNDANFFNRVRRGTYKISPEGIAILNQHLSFTDFANVLRMARAKKVSDDDKNETPTNAASDVYVPPAETSYELNPFEQLDSALSAINSQLSIDIMTSIMSIEGRNGDTFFEEAVTDLLEKMGYGKGSVTQASNDGGIDGVIKTDPLGFNPIFIQAKRYSPDNKVGRPQIQQFAGALGSVSRGAFITTSSFTREAIEWAKQYPHADIVLINGSKLTQLMIQYNVGVSTEREIAIKRLDTDYFEL